MSSFPPTRVVNARLVFNCLTCGNLVSVDTGFQPNVECTNCKARYSLMSPDINLVRVSLGRHPSLWYSNDYDGRHDPLPTPAPPLAPATPPNPIENLPGSSDPTLKRATPEGMGMVNGIPSV